MLAEGMLVAHAIQAGALRENPNSGPDGVGVQEGMAYTLEARAEVQAVCITGAQCVTGEITHALKAEGADASEDGTGRGNPIVACSEIAPTIKRDYGKGYGDGEMSGGLVAQTVALRGREGGATAELGGEVATALRASGGGGDKAHVLAFQSSQSGVRVGETHATLDSNNGSRRHNGVIQQSAVRRLTPVECERLQGFPDNYTNIPWRNKPTSPDGPRYKALGNSWAVPKFRWIGERINRMMPDNNNEAMNEAA